MTNQSNEVNFCIYYQAIVDRPLCWYVIAVLKSYDHIAFDRTIDVESNLIEFFVPPLTEAIFLSVMARLVKEGLVHNLVKLPNRLELPNQFV